MIVCAAASGSKPIGELCAIGAQAVSQQFLQLPVEGFDPLADLLLLGSAVDRRIDRKASALALDARTERDEAGQPAVDRVARRRAVVDDAFGMRDDAARDSAPAPSRNSAFLSPKAA